MKHIGEIMPNLKVIDLNKNFDEEECKVCGAPIKFSKNEYKKACEGCGTWVFQRLKEKRTREKKIKCFICMDKGIVDYWVQKDGSLYSYVARCTCPRGVKWSEAIPILGECKYSPNVEFIEKRNRRMNKKLDTPY